MHRRGLAQLQRHVLGCHPAELLEVLHEYRPFLCGELPLRLSEGRLQLATEKRQMLLRPCGMIGRQLPTACAMNSLGDFGCPALPRTHRPKPTASRKVPPPQTPAICRPTPHTAPWHDPTLQPQPARSYEIRPWPFRPANLSVHSARRPGAGASMWPRCGPPPHISSRSLGPCSHLPWPCSHDTLSRLADDYAWPRQSGL